MTHTLKTWPPFFEAVASGVKTFELRRDDRPYTVGDVLQLQEWAPDTGTHTGRTVDRAIAYIVRDAPHFGLMPGFVILGIGPVPKPIPTLDLPPAPDGMRWARAFNRAAKFHLWREHPNAHPGLRWRRECVPYGPKHNADLTDKVTPSSRACPACLAIASKGAQ